MLKGSPRGRQFCVYSSDVASTWAPLCMQVTLRDAVPLEPHRDEHDPQGLTTKLYCPHAAWLQGSAGSSVSVYAF